MKVTKMTNNSESDGGNGGGRVVMVDTNAIPTDRIDPSTWDVKFAHAADTKEFRARCDLGCDSRYPIIVAEPYPHRDTSRFSLQYDRLSRWLWAAAIHSASKAAVVVVTYPADVPIVQELLLANIGFGAPFTVIPVIPGSDTRTSYEQVMVIGRRPEPPPAASFFQEDGRWIRDPFEVAKRFMPEATRGLHLFARRDSNWPSIKMDVMRIGGGWQPWDDGDDTQLYPKRK
jgi:hypothetical protein